MAEGRSLRADVFMIIAIIVVQVGGFWMTGEAVEEKTESLRAKLSIIETTSQQGVEKLADVQKQLAEIRKSHGAAAAAVAPAAAPATSSPGAAAPPAPVKKPAAPPAAKAPAAKAP